MSRLGVKGAVARGFVASVALVLGACDAHVLPTRSEEDFTLATRVAQTLARSIETLPGVAQAEVHVLFAPAPALAETPRERGAAHASALVHVRDARAHVDVAAVQALIAGALGEPVASRINVVVAPLAVPAAPAPKLAQLGPFRVEQASEPSLRALLVLLLVVQATLAALLCFVLMRARKAH